MDFLSLKQQAFGLDISDLSIKIIELKKKAQSFKLTSYGEFAVPPNVITGGEIKDKKVLAELIKKSLPKIKGRRLSTNNVVVSLPEEKSFTQVIQMPIMDQDELKTAVQYEAENYVPLPMEKVYLDFEKIEPIHDHLDHSDILIAALPRTTVDPYLEVLIESGLNPLCFEIESQSVSHSLIKDAKTTNRVLVIDLGATRTGLLVFAGYSMRFTSSSQVCGSLFDQRISKELSIDLKQAEKLKIKHGLDKKSKVFSILVPALTDLSEQIKKYLEYYYSHIGHEHLPPNGKTTEKVLLCGGGANLKGIDKFLQEQLGIPVEIGNPWVNVLAKPEKGVRKMSAAQSLKYTTAIGLALRGARKND